MKIAQADHFVFTDKETPGSRETAFEQAILDFALTGTPVIGKPTGPDALTMDTSDDPGHAEIFEAAILDFALTDSF